MLSLLISAIVETHPYYYCYGDLGYGVVDMAALCGGAQPGERGTSGPVTPIPTRESDAGRVLRYWAESVRGLPTPHPAILEDMQQSGEIVPYADALAYCDAVLNGGWFGREAEWIVFMAQGDDSLARHFAIVAAIGDVIVCP